MSDGRPPRDWTHVLTALMDALPLCLSVVAALFILLGAGGVTPSEAVSLASSALGIAGNSTMLRSIAEARADARVGGALLLLATVVQFAALVRSKRWSDVGPPDPRGLVLAAVVAVLIGGVGYAWRGAAADRFEAEAREVAAAEAAEGARRVREAEEKKHAADEHFMRETMNRARGGTGLLPMRETPPPP